MLLRILTTSPGKDETERLVVIPTVDGSEAVCVAQEAICSGYIGLRKLVERRSDRWLVELHGHTVSGFAQVWVNARDLALAELAPA